MQRKCGSYSVSKKTTKQVRVWRLRDFVLLCTLTYIPITKGVPFLVAFVSFLEYCVCILISCVYIYSAQIYTHSSLFIKARFSELCFPETGTEKGQYQETSDRGRTRVGHLCEKRSTNQPPNRAHIFSIQKLDLFHIREGPKLSHPLHVVPQAVQKRAFTLCVLLLDRKFFEFSSKFSRVCFIFA